jgi:outer membrane protein assembly factor BamB
MKTVTITLSAILLLGAAGLGISRLGGVEPTKSKTAAKTAVNDATGTKTARPSDSAEMPDNPPQGVGPLDWGQWGGSSRRNNTPQGKNIPTDWKIGTFDPKTGEWNKEDAENIVWVSSLGSQSYGNPVVANGQVYVGTNNGAGYLKRYPAAIDLGVLLAFSEKDGKFLWQHSNEKLPTGRVHDWPLQGVCATPLVEGNRLWYVTNRGEVICLDTQGFHDNKDNGPVVNEPGRLFDVVRNEDPSKDRLADSLKSLKAGQVPLAMADEFKVVGLPVPADLKVVPASIEELKAVGLVAESEKTITEGQNFKATFTPSGGAKREVIMRLEGPRLSIYKLINTDDKDEADVIWRLNMMKQLGVSQHNMCSCSVTTVGDILYVNTSNGVDEGHANLPAPHAPTFAAVDKNTGKVIWTDNSPGANVLHGQWSSPAYAVLGGVPQVIFGGGDGWLYSFRGDGTVHDGKPELLWTFDCNPKEAKYVLGGRADRNHIIGTPVIYEGMVYVGVGEDPEHGEGVGHFWCIDPTKRGDVSSELAFSVKDLTKPLPHRRLQAVNQAAGEVARANPNSAAVWHYASYDRNQNGKIEFEETMHRTCGTAAIKDGLLYVADFSGLFHCLDAKTGVPYWTHDMLAAAWGSPLIVDGKVYVGDEDGDISVFKLSKEMELLAENPMSSSVYSTPVVANNTLFIADKDHVFAIRAAAE